MLRGRLRADGSWSSSEESPVEQLQQVGRLSSGRHPPLRTVDLLDSGRNGPTLCHCRLGAVTATTQRHDATNDEQRCHEGQTTEEAPGRRIRDRPSVATRGRRPRKRRRGSSHSQESNRGRCGHAETGEPHRFGQSIRRDWRKPGFVVSRMHAAERRARAYPTARLPRDRAGTRGLILEKRGRRTGPLAIPLAVGPGELAAVPVRSRSPRSRLRGHSPAACGSWSRRPPGRRA